MSYGPIPASRQVLLALALAALLVFSKEAAAESTEAFLKRITAATKVPDQDRKRQALSDLFYFKGVDEATRARFKAKVIDRVMMKYIDPVLALAPLPEEFEGTHVKDGAEYRPTLPLLGIVIINETTRLAYGESGGRYYIAASTKTVVNPHAARDIPLSILVIGTRLPERVQFKGTCSVLLSNNEEKKLTVDDQGIGSYSLTLPGQHITACKILRSSAKGRFQLVLTEGDHEVFKSEFMDSDQPLLFKRKAR